MVSPIFNDTDLPGMSSAAYISAECAPKANESDAKKLVEFYVTQAGIGSNGRDDELDAWVTWIIENIKDSKEGGQEMVERLLCLTEHHKLAHYWVNADFKVKKHLLIAVYDFVPKDQVRMTWDRMSENMGFCRDEKASSDVKCIVIRKLIDSVEDEVSVEVFSELLEFSVDICKGLHDRRIIQPSEQGVDALGVAIRLDLIFKMCSEIEWEEQQTGVRIHDVLRLCFTDISMNTMQSGTSGKEEAGGCSEQKSVEDLCIERLAAAQSEESFVKEAVAILMDDAALRLHPLFVKGLLLGSLHEAIFDASSSFASWSVALAACIMRIPKFDAAAFSYNASQDMSKLLCKSSYLSNAEIERRANKSIRLFFESTCLKENQMVQAIRELIHVLWKVCRFDRSNVPLKHKTVEYSCYMLKFLADRVSNEEYACTYALHENVCSAVLGKDAVSEYSEQGYTPGEHAQAAVEGCVQWKSQRKNPYKDYLAWLQGSAVLQDLIENQIAIHMSTVESYSALKEALMLLDIPAGHSFLQRLQDDTLDLLVSILTAGTMPLHEAAACVFLICGTDFPYEGDDVAACAEAFMEFFKGKEALSYRELRLICAFIQLLDFSVLTSEMQKSVEEVLTKPFYFDPLYAEGRPDRRSPNDVEYPDRRSIVHQLTAIQKKWGAAAKGEAPLRGVFRSINMNWLKESLAFMVAVSERYKTEFDAIAKRAAKQTDYRFVQTVGEVSKMSDRIKPVTLHQIMCCGKDIFTDVKSDKSGESKELVNTMTVLLTEISKTEFNFCGMGKRLVYADKKWRLAESGLGGRPKPIAKVAATPPVARKLTAVEQMIFRRERAALNRADKRQEERKAGVVRGSRVGASPLAKGSSPSPLRSPTRPIT